MKIIFSNYLFVMIELLMNKLPEYSYSLEIKSLEQHKNILNNDYDRRAYFINNMWKNISVINKELIDRKREIEIKYITKKDENKTQNIHIDNNISVTLFGIKSLVCAKYSNNIDITEIMKYFMVSEIVPSLLNISLQINYEFNKVIPIGNRCILSGILRKLKLHGESLPFDNIASSPKLIQPFFDKINADNFYVPFDNKKKSLYHNGIFFGHFNYRSNKTKHDEISDSFNRKFKRLFSILENNDNNVLFVFADTDSLYKSNDTKFISNKYYNELIEFDKFISSRYKIKYTIISFHINEKFSDTGNIKNYTIKLGNNENRDIKSGYYNIYNKTTQRYLWHLASLEIKKILKNIKIV